MDFFQAAFLGALQGLTEFLPVSSSGHLILMPWVLGWGNHSLTFDIALHLGTLLPLLAYFWRDWLRLIGSAWADLARRPIALAGEGRLVWLIALGSLPAAVLGLLGEDAIERTLRHPLPVSSLLITVGLLLILAEAVSRRTRGLESIGLLDALAIGFAQALALAPGVSRSGITIAAGLFLGLDRVAAARFSFLLATPVVFGAGLLKVIEGLRQGLPQQEIGAMVVGFLVASIFGFLAIRFLLTYLLRYSVRPFAYYRIIAGLTFIGLLIARGY